MKKASALNLMQDSINTAKNLFDKNIKQSKKRTECSEDILEDISFILKLLNSSLVNQTYYRQASLFVHSLLNLVKNQERYIQ